MKILRRILYLLRQRQIEADIAEELETHRQMARDRALHDGAALPEASAASRRAMGNVTLAREDARAEWIAPWLESVWQDLRYGVRHLRAHPVFTITTGGDAAAGDGAEYQLLHPVQRDGAADLAGAGRRTSRHGALEIARTRRHRRRVDVRLRVHAETGALVRRLVCDSRQRQSRLDDATGDRRVHLLRPVRVRERELLPGPAHPDGHRARLHARRRSARPAGIGRHHQRRPVAAGVRRRSQRARPHHLRASAAGDHRRRHGAERQRHVSLHQ